MFRRLEKLHDVARRILDESLAATVALDDTGTECTTGHLSGGDGHVEVVQVELEAAPPAWLRHAPIGRGLPGAAGSGGIEQEPKITSAKHGEPGSGLQIDTEAVLVGVELGCCSHVVDDVTDGCHDRALGDGGWRLSSGEAARISLARAILRNPDVLVLDETTAALDAPSQQQILDVAQQHCNTIVLIAHP